MKLSVKSDYAARAVLGLARHFHESRALRAEQLADEEGLPANFLVQILLDLKNAGIVRSQRGKIGGYFLARPPSAITLADVMRAVHGTVMDISVLEESKCPAELKESWGRMRDALEKVGGSTHFQALLERSEGKEKMYYI